MRITALEVRSYQLKKAFRGYDEREVQHLKELASDALEEATREIGSLEDRLREANARLSDHIAQEDILKSTITTAQSMVEDIKANAKKEAELLLAEARLQADEIIRQAQSRATQIQEEIFRLKRQRIELETSIRAILDYHSNTLVMEGEESKKADEGSDKLKFFPK